MLYRFAHTRCLQRPEALALLEYALARLKAVRSTQSLDLERYLRQVMRNRQRAQEPTPAVPETTPPLSADSIAAHWPALAPEQRDLLFLWADLGLSPEAIARECHHTEAEVRARLAALNPAWQALPAAPDSLTTAVRAITQDTALSPDEMNQLNDRLNTRQRRFTSTGVKLAGLLLLAGLALFAWEQWRDFERRALIDSLVAEVVDQHRQRPSPAVTGSALVLLSQGLNELDFTLADSLALPTLAEQLEGASYGRIQGRTAAALHLGPDTLYQVPVNREQEQLLDDINIDRHPVIRIARGFTVTLWEERGLLMALVDAPEATESPVAPPTLPAPALTPEPAKAPDAQ